MLQNEHSFARIGFDTAENGPLNVCQQLAKSYYGREKVRTNIGSFAAGQVAFVSEFVPSCG